MTPHVGTPRPTAWLLACAALALAGCGGGDGAPETGAALADPPTSDAVEVLADAVRIDATVDVALAGAEFATVEGEPAPVAVGDVVRTDDAGFAEVAYYDGSVTRLDVDTSLEVLALSDAPDTAEIRTRMDLGRTWNRVADDVPDRTFTVETNVAVATVRGTVFIVDCPEADTCTFTVLEGSVEITPTDGDPVLLEAPDALRVTAAGDTDDTVPVADPTTDDWLARNLDLDGDAGFEPPPTTEPDAPGLEALAGSWTATGANPRIASAVGHYAGSTLSETTPLAMLVDRASGDRCCLIGRLGGSVEMTCAARTCSLSWTVSHPETGEFDTGASFSEAGGVLSWSPSSCPELLPPGANATDSWSEDRITVTRASVILQSEGDCSDHLVLLDDVTLERQR